MGRKKGSKTKKNKVSGSGKPNGQVEAEQQRTYYKIKATFKCSRDTCGKLWTSVHAWERDEEIFCEMCESRAQVDKFLDEMCDLDNYDCPKCPGEHWQSIHSEVPRTEECYECGTSVRPNGTQRRFGRHFWFECSNNACKATWEDFSLSPQRTQRCSKQNCQGRGDVIQTTKVQPRRRGEGDGGGPGGGGQHNAENCDMCCDLKRAGISQTCLRYRKVQCRVTELGDGLYTETLTAAS